MPSSACCHSGQHGCKLLLYKWALYAAWLKQNSFAAAIATQSRCRYVSLQETSIPILHYASHCQMS